MTALANPFAAGLARHAREIAPPPSGGAGTPPNAGAAVGAVVAPAPPALHLPDSTVALLVRDLGRWLG